MLFETDPILKIERDKKIKNTSISRVKFSWTTLRSSLNDVHLYWSSSAAVAGMLRSASM